MSNKRSTAEVAEHFSDYIDRVADHGERFVLMRGTQPVAELRPVTTTQYLEELPEILASLPHLSSDEAMDFGEDLETARSQLRTSELNDPWQS